MKFTILRKKAMQRFLPQLLLGSCFVVMLTCSAGLLLAAGHQRDDLILPSATDVRIDGCKRFHRCITYAVLPGTTQAKLSQHLVQHGWRRLRGDNAADPPWVFVRESWFGLLREVATAGVSRVEQGIAEVRVELYFRVRWPTGHGVAVYAQPKRYR
jgi:hypothetical protein